MAIYNYRAYHDFEIEADNDADALNRLLCDIGMIESTGLDIELRSKTDEGHDDGEYGRLRDRYHITNEDMKLMNELRRKWAFDDFMCEINGNGDEFYFEMTDEQVESILDEYLERRVYDRSDQELSIDSEDMWDSIHKVVGYPEEE